MTQPPVSSSAIASRTASSAFLAEPAILRWVRYRGGRVEEQGPEAGATGARVRLRVRFDAAEEALQFALSFGPDLDVVEP